MTEISQVYNTVAERFSLKEISLNFQDEFTLREKIRIRTCDSISGQLRSPIVI
jgi:hypothetical protein